MKGHPQPTLPDHIIRGSIARLNAMWRDAWSFDEILEPDQWADKYMQLSTRDSSAPGPFVTGRFPFLIEILRQFGVKSSTERIVGMTCRQIGKSTIIRIIVGWAAHQNPSTIVIAQPTSNTAKRFSKRTIGPFIKETPVLASRFFGKETRDPKNTLLLKEFVDGVLAILGGQSSAELRGLSSPLVLVDEAGDFKKDVDGQGDPLKIVAKCAAGFPNHHIGYFGNPGIRNRCRVEDLFREGTQERYDVPCPHCGYMAMLTWDGREWFSLPLDAPAPHHRVEWDHALEDSDPAAAAATAHFVCGNPARQEDGSAVCGRPIEEHYKMWMMDPARARWTSTAAGDGVTRSFRLSALYAPLGFQSLKTCVTEYFNALKDPIRGLRAWVNDDLGETFAGETEELAADDLKDRLERYEAEVPRGVGMLTVGVDTQEDRLIYLVVGWGYPLGLYREGAVPDMYIIEWGELLGDPGKDTVWRELDERVVRREFKHASGQKMRPSRVCVDSGGKKGHTERVYRYCAARLEFGVFAVKGGREVRKPLVGMPSRHNIYRTPLFVLCTDTGKFELLNRLRNRLKPEPGKPSPGFVHIPEMPLELAEEFSKQMTSERALYKPKGRVWEPVYTNHLWDCAVYALAGLYIWSREPENGLQALVELMNEPAKDEQPPPAAPAPFRARRGGKWSGWVR